MKKILAVLVFLFASTVAAQPVPSTYTPLTPCVFFKGALPAGSTAFLLVRGSCNVPSSANAVAFVAVAIAPPANGFLRLWESSLPSAEPILDYRGGPGNVSTFALVRLCYPIGECAGEDLAMQSSTSLVVVLKVVGYTEEHHTLAF